MKKENAREAVIAEWSRWALQHLKGKEAATSRDVERFIRHLKDERPTFLMFRAKQGPEQMARDWLRDAGVTGK
jgi:hypothetical protein